MFLIKKVTSNTYISPHPWCDHSTCSLHTYWDMKIRHYLLRDIHRYANTWSNTSLTKSDIFFNGENKERSLAISVIYRLPWNTRHAVHGLSAWDNTFMNACKSVIRFTIIIRAPPSSIISDTKHRTCGTSVWSYILPLKIISHHYNDVIMGTIASQITSLTIVYSTVYSDADQRIHQSSASLAFVRGIHRGPVNSPHKWPVTRKMFPFDDVITSATKHRTCGTSVWSHILPLKIINQFMFLRNSFEQASDRYTDTCFIVCMRNMSGQSVHA